MTKIKDKNIKTTVNIKTISKQIKSTLKKYYGYDSFREGQEEIITNILSGKDVLAILPTGAGKSICYQIPSIILPGITIVISPLISLMQDQVESLKKIGVSVALINSTLSSKEQFMTFENAKKGKYKLLYISPERLNTPNFIKFTKEANISLVAIDEAHCVSTWGHDFRPSYKLIKEFIMSLTKKPIVAAFTATATKKVIKDITKLLDLDDPFIISNSFDRPNIYFSSYHLNEKDKIKFIENYITEHKSMYGIIYCQTRNNVEDLTRYLKTKKHNVSMYHAGMTEALKKKTQDDFIKDKINIIVATNAFGMGINKPNVSFVIHFNMPKDMEAYYQEAGRAGRDGNDSEAILLFDTKDTKINKFMIEKNLEQNPLVPFKERVTLEKYQLKNLEKMIGYANATSCLRKSILKYFDDKTHKIIRCDNCIVCNKKQKLYDIKEETLKILSCIKRCNEKEDVDVICDILIGNQTEYILKNNYNKLTTFSILKLKKEELKIIFDYLIEKDFLLNVKTNNTNILKLTKKSKEFIKSNTQIIMKMQTSLYNLLITLKVKEEKEKEKEKESHLKNKLTRSEINNASNLKTENILNKISTTINFNNDDEKLYKLLNLTKKNIAQKCNIPELMVVKPSIINELTLRKPKTIKELNEIPGLTKEKIDKYGQIFIGVINTYDDIRKLK